jgi:hypothetical protein
MPHGPLHCIPHRLRAGVVLALALSVAACASETPRTPPPPEGTPERVVHDAIEAHGGERFHALQLEFDFRGTPFLVVYDDGLFVFERRTTGPDGRTVVDRMDNDGTTRTVNGTQIDLAPQELASLETAVNSVVYFALLPWRLQDPAVHLRDLGDAELDGEPYRKIEVTFEPDGGGRDWEDQFVYWFHRDTHMLDFMAYRYHTGEGGTRFRRAVNRREVEGIVLQDYENFAAEGDLDDVAAYDELYRTGRLRLVSLVELEAVRISVPPR